MGATRDDQQDRSQCTPCRGTGKLTSGKGGEPHTVTCPWCEGSGQFSAGHDAQAVGAADTSAAADTSS